MSFRVEDYSDRELLLALNDVSDDDGWGSAEEVADNLGLHEFLERPRRSVAVRFSWLVRYGVLEREHLLDEHGRPKFTRRGEPRWGQRWKLTPVGRAVALGRLNKTQERWLENIPEDRLMVLTRMVGQRQRDANPVAAKLVQREWRYATSERRED